MKKIINAFLSAGVLGGASGAKAEGSYYIENFVQQVQNSSAQDLTYNGLINQHEFYKTIDPGNAYDPNGPRNFAAYFTIETGMGAAPTAHTCNTIVNETAAVETKLLDLFDEYAKMGGVPSNRNALEPKVKELVAKAVADCSPQVSFYKGLGLRL